MYVMNTIPFIDTLVESWSPLSDCHMQATAITVVTTQPQLSLNWSWLKTHDVPYSETFKILQAILMHIILRSRTLNGWSK